MPLRLLAHGMSAGPIPDTASALAADRLRAPSLRRRLACFLYEGVLLFGVVMAAGLLYAIATQQRHALQGLIGLQLVVFVVLGAYFAVCWSRSGQTLAMQTWQIRVVTAAGGPLSLARALGRYVLAWGWFIPGLLAVWLAGLKGPAATFSVLIAGVLAYAALSWLRADRQYWHDAVCGTRLVDCRADPPKATR